MEYENYAKAINIEARTMIDMAGKQIIPAVIKYTTQLAASIAAVKGACPEADISTQTSLLLETSGLLAETKSALSKLEEETAQAAGTRAERARRRLTTQCGAGYGGPARACG